MFSAGPGFSDGPTEYGSIKTGTKTLDDATINVGSIPKVHHRFGNKYFVLKAIADRDYGLMREISDYFYNTNGIYARFCNYMAYLYRYDWYIAPEIIDDSVKEEKVLTDFNNILRFLDNSHIKKLCGDIALEVVKYGAYYGYLCPSSKGIVLQQLPIAYCRTRFKSGNMPVVEFDMRYFDDNFKDIKYRMRILNMFPPEFKKGYILYQQGKLINDDDYWSLNRKDDYFHSESLRGNHTKGYWYPLTPGSAIKFSITGSGDQPLFIDAIPDIIDLDGAKDLDRRKQLQQLQKIVIQKLPIDKNGDLIFDIDEARDLHNNAIEMLNHSIGTDVLTTFADIKVEDIGDNNASDQTDVLERQERAVFNAFGSSNNLFNTDGNMALSKSILNDESYMRDLLLQFHIFFDNITESLGKNKKKYTFRFYMLETTQNNYIDLAKMYKEQVQIGYSKMLPQIAMGHSQSSIIHTAFFENNVLHLSEIMIPPLMSSTMNPDAILGNNNKSNSGDSQNNTGGSSQTKVMKTETNAGGRPQKAEDQLTEKTIQNKESQS